MDSAGGYERTLATSDAISSGIAHLEELGLKPRFREVGNGVVTTHCDLIGDNRTEASGIGKGIAEQSKASALFEAIEHFHWYRSQVEDTLVPELLDLDGADKALANASPDFGFICGKQQVSFSRMSFEPLGSVKENLSFPFFLTNPFWESHNENEKDTLSRFSLRRYSTNSGTASGITRSEANIHALLETIERDAIGIELLRTVVRKQPYPVRRIVLDSLSLNMQDLIKEITGQDLEVIGFFNMTTSDLKVPVILVGLIDKRSGRRCFGTGASLSAEYAVERALLEALQTIHAWREINAPIHHKYEGVVNGPAYMRCALDRGYFGYLGGEINQEFSSIDQGIDFGTTLVDSQIKILCERLHDYGISVYTRNLYQGIVSVQQIVIPELERFHIVTAGIPVMPSVRGRQALQ